MVAQNSNIGNHEHPARVEWHLPDVQCQLDALKQLIEQSAQDGTAAHLVERGLFDGLLALGKTLFQGFLPVSAFVCGLRR